MENSMMKNLICLILVAIFSFSCSKDDDEEAFLLDENTTIVSNENVNSKSAALTYRFNEIYGSCNDDSLDNGDLEVLFSQPLDQDAIFTFWVKKVPKKTDKYPVGYIFTPYRNVEVKAGSRSVILDTSCELPDRIACGKITQNKTRKFEVFLTKAIYTSTLNPINLAPINNKNSYTVNMARPCYGSSGDGDVDDFHGFTGFRERDNGSTKPK